MKEDINPTNAIGQRHGKWVTFLLDKPWYTGTYKNGKAVGYWIFYKRYAKTPSKEFHIK